MIIGIDASRITREDRTGTENYSYNLINALIAADKKNRYVLYFNKIPQFFEISQTNVSTRIIPMTRFWTQARLAFEMISNPPDVLFVPAHTIPVIRRPGIKTVVTIHDLGAEFLAQYHQFPQKIYLNWSTRYVARWASQIISVSKFTKTELMKTLNVPSERINVVYEAVDRNLFKPASKHQIAQVRSKYGLAGKYILYVGTIQPRKNLVRLIEAFSKARLPQTDLVLSGSKGWLYEEIYQAPAKFSVSNHVRFLDFVPNEDLVALYSGALGLAFPSLYEGFGLPVLEAFATGCPVLTTNNGATAEVAGGSALLVNPLDINSITKGLQKLSSKDKYRLDLKQKGFKRVEDFSWEKTAHETIKVFEKLVGGK